MEAFDSTVARFTVSAKQLGSSEDMIFAANELRSSVLDVLYFLNKNAYDLFPSPQLERRLKEPPGWIEDDDDRIGDDNRSEVRKKEMDALHSFRRVIGDTIRGSPILQLDDLPGILQHFAEDVKAFRNRINDFPEFKSPHVNGPIREFEDGLQTSASDFKGFFGETLTRHAVPLF